MQRVFLKAGGWELGPVSRARSFTQRWRGLRSRNAGGGLLLRTRSVHGFGMRDPFLAVGLSDDLRVVAARVVSPGGVAYFSGCRWVLELPLEADPPPPGATLEVSDA